MNIIFNQKSYTAQEGQTVIQAARDNGVSIPSLCYHAKTGGLGKCRVCVVEIKGMSGLATACTTQVTADMEITTESPVLRQHRRMIVDLLLSSGHHDCLSCPQCGSCELQDLAYALEIEHPSFALPERLPRDETAEFFVFDASKCIKCGRCVVADNCTVVNETLSFAHRGDATRVNFDHGLPIGSSSCVQCGECVQLCPTGALTDKKSLGLGRAWELEKVNTTCPYCGVGCQLTLHVDRANNRVVRSTGREVAPNQGMLCVKGRYGFDFPASPRRLQQPMIRKNGRLEPVSWDEALDYTATRIREIVAEHGPEVFSAFGSGRITSENNYAIQKFTRAVIGTNNVDHCART